MIRKSGSHYYSISIRTRAMKRELKAGPAAGGKEIAVSSGEEREKA
jgi:hypothetical protein